jgi:cellulose synthase/poly-beta-1,6-N-acetylglucosamine synthase-like glycosyltransferase
MLLLVRTLAKRPVNVRSQEPAVCLFITANDEAAIIDAKLRNSLALDYPADRLEVVVASDGSVDGTNEIVRRFAPRVRLVELSPRRGKIAAINSGLGSVASEIVIFSDANTFLDAGAVRAFVANLRTRRWGRERRRRVDCGVRLALSEDLTTSGAGSAGRIGSRLDDWRRWRLMLIRRGHSPPRRQHHSRDI